MKKRIIAAVLLSVFVFISFAFCATTKTKNDNKVKIFFPPNNTLFKTNKVTLSGYSSSKSDKEYKVRIEGTGVYEYKYRLIKFKLDEANLFNVKARLYPGLNKLQFNGKTRFLFFDDKTGSVPYIFKKSYLHSEPDCENCHKVEPTFSEALNDEVNNVCNECHDKVEDKKNIHPGFEESTCVECHNPHFSKYEGHLQKPMKALCFDCHDDVTAIQDAEFSVVHSPVEKGECNKCHDPHASDNESLLLKEKYELCTSCHVEPRDFGHASEYDDCSLCHEHHAAKRFVLLKEKYWENCLDCHDEVAGQKFKHMPKGRGCGDCHNPHSDTDLQDVVKGCRNCHKPDDKNFARFHGGLVLPVEKCFVCHTPHDAYNQSLLKSRLHFPLTQSGNCGVCHTMQGRDKKKLGWIVERSEVCFKCHGDKKPLIGYDSSVHPPVLNGDCVQCHSPHLKLKRKQLLEPIETLCFKCHDNFVETMLGYGEGASLHPPVEERDCLVCHDPHQSENFALLRTELNTICFECHDDNVATLNGRTIVYFHEPPTSELCTKCHSPHMSRKKKLLKERD